MTTFNTMNDWKQAQVKLAAKLGRDGREFNLFVKDSIRFFHTTGNHSINIINSLVRMVEIGKMGSAARMVAYLNVFIPHDYSQELKKDRTKVWRFGAKSEGKDYLSIEKIESLLMTTKDWFAYGREVTPSAFDLDSALAKVIRMAVKNNKSIDEVINHTRSLYFKEVTAKADKAAAKASKAA